ncbi:MAG: hypothetical protein Q8933_15045 [Bacteroidota bacterium]|nr:hypothetical protein [Bacteroidota bacterium]MDP4191387.1 hypothetical protein [Bacteroidota bacterium]MDP4194305.1 hypothetical protein [Bacteroidota bacterium]
MRTDLNYNVMNSLKMLETNRLTQLELHSFTEFCCNVSYSCVSKRKKKLSRLTSKYGTTLEDIATNALIPLFSKNESDEFYILKNAYKKWYPEIKTQHDAIDFLSKIIDHRVEQQITAFLKENDPCFAKIHSYILHLCKKESLVRKIYKGTIYIVKSSNKKLEGNFIDYYNFQMLPLRLFNENENMLCNILSYLKRETCFSQAIPLNHLINKLKGLWENEHETFCESAHIHSHLMINDLVNQGLKNALKKLETTYVNKGKLTKSEAEIFRLTLRDLAEDIKDGGIHPGLYEYLCAHMDNLNKDEYKEKYHNFLEYLYKVIKTSIAAQLQN